MAGLAPLLLLLRLSLSTCCVLLLLLLAACPSLAIAPCQKNSYMSAFDSFKNKHLPEGTPNTLDQNAWYKFIKDNTPLCDRPTQSFLSPDMLDQVKAVCSSQGGKVCEIISVKGETKYLILGCNRVNNNCLPVHFEGNPDDEKPDNNACDCQAPTTAFPSTSRGTRTTKNPTTTPVTANADTNDAGTPTWLWLITSVMVLIV